MEAKTTTSEDDAQSISRLSVSGFKSIGPTTSIDIRPLTVLAGANNSGKSSFMQPLLMLKQTMEASYDPGSLLIGGPNVSFTSARQFLAKAGSGEARQDVEVGIGIGDNDVRLCFSHRPRKGIELREMVIGQRGKRKNHLKPGKVGEAMLSSVFDPALKSLLASGSEGEGGGDPTWRVRIVNDRCFLTFQYGGADEAMGFSFNPWTHFQNAIRDVIHLPGLRGNPARSYPVTAVRASFPGQFQQYTASVIARFQSSRRKAELQQLDDDLRTLGLAGSARAKRVNETEVRLRVNRLQGTQARQAEVNIADVGLGVSQVLPILVALLVARTGQLVYIEQPEIHLHPRAQLALTQILARAAVRGVRVVIETHSALILLGLQTAISDQANPLTSADVALHWFSLKRGGETRVRSGELDECGAYGDWPEDFGDIQLLAESDYLNTLEQR